MVGRGLSYIPSLCVSVSVSFTEEQHCEEETPTGVSLQRPRWDLWPRTAAYTPAWEGPGSGGIPSLRGRPGSLGPRVGL